MSNQTEHPGEQTINAQELRQSLRAEIEASKQAIEELSDEQVETIVGGMDQKDEQIVGIGIPAVVMAISTGIYAGVKKPSSLSLPSPTANHVPQEMHNTIVNFDHEHAQNLRPIKIKELITI